MHALLSHLHSVGFHGAPRPLGVDDAGREVLTFIEGSVPWPEQFDLLNGDEPVARAARLIRDFHDAVETFTAPPDAQWQVLVPADGEEIIAHHDLAPWNLVLNEAAWSIIDWDTAAPGTRLGDLAYALHGFVPLSAGSRSHHPHEPTHRMRVFVDAYGLDEPRRVELIALLAARARAMYDFLASEAAARHQPWKSLWDQGHGSAWLADSRYIEDREADWRRALLD